MNRQGILIGMAGGTGSGKTLIAQRIIEQLGSREVVVIQQDSYYKDLSHLPFEQRVAYNFDHPSAFDKETLVCDLTSLLSMKTIQQPIYNFTTHTREKETKAVGPHTVIVLDGILVLEDPDLRKLMDIKVYVDTDADIRLARRIRRDIMERGRDINSVLTQYENTVRMMHLLFIEPSKRYADIIIPEGGFNSVAIDLLVTKIRDILQQKRISL